MNRLWLFSTLVLFLFSFSGCKVRYSLSGASTGDAKTVSVSFFRNTAPLVYPPLSRDFTDALRDRFVSDTNLTLVQEEGDLHFEGEITSYTTQPMAVTATEKAATFRLSVTVRVVYTNELDQQFEFDKSFTRFREYSADFASVEAELVEEIVKDLVEDIFKESVVNW